MKILKYFFSILVLLIGFNAQGFLVASSFRQGVNGSYGRITTVTCEPDDQSSCFILCGREDKCEREEPFCRNCAGTASPLLRELFTEISKYYKVVDRIDPRSMLIQYLKREVYVLLDVKSIFDYYHSIESDQFIQELKTYCGDRADKSLLAVTLDAVNQPRELKYVLCQNNQNQTVPIEVKSRLSNLVVPRLRTPIFFQLK